jgi:hypothetical protein
VRVIAWFSFEFGVTLPQVINSILLISQDIWIMPPFQGIIPFAFRDIEYPGLVRSKKNKTLRVFARIEKILTHEV